MDVLKFYYYVLYKLYRAQQVMLRWPLASRNGLHVNAAALLTMLEIDALLILGVKLAGIHFPIHFATKAQAYVVLIGFMVFAVFVAYLNYRLFRTPLWWKWIVEFRSYSQHRRRLGSWAVFLFLLLVLALPLFI